MNSKSLLLTKTNRLWRPAMAWLYFTICLFDFIIGPVFWSIIQQDAKTIAQWVPLTTRGGGLFHMAMMAIIGITAWGRTQEKINMNPFGMEMQRDTFNISPLEQPAEVHKKQQFGDEPPPIIKRRQNKQ